MSQASSLEREMLNLINAERTSRGLNPVELELRLNSAAEDHSDWMLDTGIFSHTGVGSSSATQRIRDSGFELSGSWSTAENIAWQSQRGVPGFSDDVVDLHNALMNSSGHRANILNPGLAYIGIGIEIGAFQGIPAVMVTQNFARTAAGVQLDNGQGSSDDADAPPADPIVIVDQPDSGDVSDPPPTQDHHTFAGENGILRMQADDLDNDVVSNLGTTNKLVLEGIEPGRSNIRFTDDSDLIIDVDGDGDTDLTISLTESPTNGDIFAIAIGGNTIVSFAGYLPSLSEGVKVDPGRINGIVNTQFLAGDGETDFRVQLADIGAAGFSNVLGVYDIQSNGEITNVRLIYDNTNTGTGAVNIPDVPAGSRLGFFIVQNAADWAAGVSNSDVLEFRASNGAVADVDDDFSLVLMLNGAEAGVTAFHAEKASLNVDDQQHALSGIAPGGEAMMIGFEDLTGGGDSDYEDVVFSVTRIETDALSTV